MTLLLSKDDRVYLNFDNGPDTTLRYRPKILTEMGKRYNIEFTEGELKEFEKYPSSVGVPISKMKEFLAAKDVKLRSAFETGIPIDSTDNQLADWILFTRQVNPNVQACIRGDAKASYPLVKRVLDIMQEKNVKQFNLITNLDAVKINLAEIQK
jgi:biopolymer transport protein ExbD